MGDVTLSNATRTNLLSLQRTSSLIGRTQERLASGLKVNSAIDDALAFFKARNLNARAADLSTIKNQISNGISTIKAAMQGLESIEAVLKQAKALAQSAVASPENEMNCPAANVVPREGVMMLGTGTRSNVTVNLAGSLVVEPASFETISRKMAPLSTN